MRCIYIEFPFIDIPGLDVPSLETEEVGLFIAILR